MSGGIYDRLFKAVDYRVLAFLPPFLGVLMFSVAYFNGLQMGLDFKGGMWVDVLTDRVFDVESVRQLEADLSAVGLRDVKVHVGLDYESSKNRLVVQTTTVIDDKAQVMEVIGKYAGRLTEYDTVTVALSQKPPVELEESLEKRLRQSLDVNYTSGVLSIVGVDLDREDVESSLRGYLGQDVKVELWRRNFNLRSVGPTFGSAFRDQGVKALLASMVFMSFVVFFSFRKLVPCVAVIQAAVFDIMIALGFMSIFGVPLEPASLAALLMLIGYSVDTDILLTTKILKERGGAELNAMFDEALKTGLTMTFTTVSALTVVYVVSTVVTQVPTWASISSVLIMGLFGDVFTTWFTNVGILKWYVEFSAGKKSGVLGGGVR